MLQHPLPHIAQVNGTSRDDGVVELLHLAHAFIDDMLPGPGSTVSLINERNSLHHQRSIVEKFSVHAENGRLARAEAGFDLLMQPVQLILGSIQRALELVPFADRVAGIVGDDKGRLLLVLAHGANIEPTGSGNASNGRTRGLRNPALTVTARSRGELLFRLIPKPYGNGRPEGIEGRCGIRALGRNANSRAMFDAQLQ